MSENMVPKILEAIQSQPEMALSMDEEGWSMLHREALAGNLSPVRLLIEAGADKSQANVNGHTPLDLAKILGWPRIIQLLE